MSRWTAALLLGSILAIALIGLGWWWSGSKGRPAVRQAAEGADSELHLAAGDTVTLYFPGLRGKLHSEPRQLEFTGDADSAVRILLTELLSGPATPGGFRIFPGEIEVGSIYLAPGGVAYVDLLSTDQRPPPRSGSQQEILSVYSLVNTLVLNLPSIERVTLLWNGQQRPSFAGHLDTSRPLSARAQLIGG